MIGLAADTEQALQIRRPDRKQIGVLHLDDLIDSLDRPPCGLEIAERMLYQRQ